MILSQLQELISKYKEASVFFPEVMVVVLTFVIETKFLNFFEIGSLESKIKKAASLGQVVEGKIDEKNSKYTGDRNYVGAKYKYSINGVEKTKTVFFRAVGTYHQFPEKINVYYLDDKIFTEHDRDDFRGILFPIIPFAVGTIVMYLRHPELFN